MNTQDRLLTTQPISVNQSRVAPEFGRCDDVRQLFGLKRGTLYNLLADGKIRGVLLRVRGKKSGVRLFDVASVRAWIHSQMEANSVHETQEQIANRKTAMKRNGIHITAGQSTLSCGRCCAQTKVNHLELPSNCATDTCTVNNGGL